MNVIGLSLSHPWLMTREAFQEMLVLAEKYDAGTIEAVAAKMGSPLAGTETASRRGRVGIVPIQGKIFRHASMMNSLCGATTTETVAKDLAQALEDPMIDSIILDVDSPGGEANGIAELASMIRAGCSQKRIVAYTGGMAASAGYYLACAASEVVIGSSAWAGSIGAVIGITDDSKAMERRGIKEYAIVSSVSPEKWPDVSTEEGRSSYQSMVDQTGDHFVNDVAAYRGVSRETVLKDFGQGGMKMGHDAVKSGMADRVGSLEGLIAELCSRGKPALTHSPGAGLLAAANTGVKSMPELENSLPADNRNDVLAKQVADLQAALKLSNDRADAEFAERVKVSVHAIASELKGQNKITPGEVANVVGAMTQAMLDDRSVPISGMTRVDSLKAMLGGRTPHTLKQESIAENDKNAAQPPATDLPAGSQVHAHTQGPENKDKPLTKDRQNHLDLLTEYGRASLATTEDGRAYLRANGFYAASPK